MDIEEGRLAARLAVQAEMAHRGWNIQQLREATGVDNGTLGDFLSGQRWPQIKTRGVIEKSLGWPAGAIAAIASGGQPPTVGASAQDADQEEQLLYRRPEGLTDAEWERVKQESREFIEWQIEKASRER